MATPGDMDLVADVVTRLTEEMDGALQEEALTRGWIAAEPSMFWYQRVRTVAQPACRKFYESLVNRYRENSSWILE